MPDDELITLCFPDGEKSCFACCPPIRPAAYEHIQFKSIIQRQLRENSCAYSKKFDHIVPITGFSCWALGYLDGQHKRIGCLLHPAGNLGKDLRYRVDFGEKCRRESCPEAGVFYGLSPGAKKAWLGLSEKLDAFSYSSRETNPIFHMLMWGAAVMEGVAADQAFRVFRRKDFFDHFPVFSSRADPRPKAYMLERIIQQEGVSILRSRAFQTGFEKKSNQVLEKFRNCGLPGEGAGPTHRLELGETFKQLLRLGLGIKKIDLESALILKKRIDKAIDSRGGRPPRGKEKD